MVGIMKGGAGTVARCLGGALQVVVHDGKGGVEEGEGLGVKLELGGSGEQGESVCEAVGGAEGETACDEGEREAGSVLKHSEAEGVGLGEVGFGSGVQVGQNEIGSAVPVEIPGDGAGEDGTEDALD